VIKPTTAEKLKASTLKIVESYASQETFLQPLNRSRLPSRETIITILAEVQ